MIIISIIFDHHKSICDIDHRNIIMYYQSYDALSFALRNYAELLSPDMLAKPSCSRP